MLAGSVPLLGIGGAMFAFTKDQQLTINIVIWLCVGGTVGFAVVYFLFLSSLQKNLQALLRIVRQ